MPVIYKPKGKAREYSLLACNLFCCDDAPAGCVHGCEYCYVPKFFSITHEQFITNIRPRNNILIKLRNDAEKLKGTDKRLLFCFTCDPYQPEEIEQGITRQALKILREYDIPFQILTKGGMRAARDFDLYGPNDAFATTMTFLLSRKSIEHEPKAAIPFERIGAIKKANELGIQTWVSLEPVLEAEQTLEIIEETKDIVDLYKIGKLNHKESSIDWRGFGIRAIDLCEKFGKQYYIKDDLAAYLDGVEFTNTDMRTVKRT